MQEVAAAGSSRPSGTGTSLSTGHTICSRQVFQMPMKTTRVPTIGSCTPGPTASTIPSPSTPGLSRPNSYLLSDLGNAGVVTRSRPKTSWDDIMCRYPRLRKRSWIARHTIRSGVAPYALASSRHDRRFQYHPTQVPHRHCPRRPAGKTIRESICAYGCA